MSEFDPERFLEMETRLAFQDDTILKMQETLRAQQLQIFELENKHQNLLERLHDLVRKDSTMGMKNEKPPHY